MAFYGVTPPTQPQTDVDLSALTVGFSKIICDGSWLGFMREGSALRLSLNPLDKDIVTANYPGTVLGVRQLGESPRIIFEAVESTLANLRKFIDLRATVSNAKLGFGRRKQVATTHTIDAYGEGPGQRTRKLALYRVALSIDGEVNLFDPEEFTTFRVIGKILPQLNLPEANWYGEFVDSPPS